MNKKYLQWIKHEFYLFIREKKNNCEPAIFYTTLQHLKWLRKYYRNNY